MVEKQPKPRGRAALPVRTGRFIRDYLEKCGEGYLSEIHSSLKFEIGEQGSFALPLVPSGRCKIQVWTKGGKLDLASFEVRAGETTQVELP